MRYFKITLGMVFFLLYSAGGAFYMGKVGAYVATIPFFANHEWYAVSALVLASYLFWVSMLLLIHLILIVWLKESSSYNDYNVVKFITGYYFVQDTKALVKGTTGWVLNKIKDKIHLFK